MFSNKTKLMKAEARKSLLAQRGETMNWNLLRKINRQIRKYKNLLEN